MARTPRRRLGADDFIYQGELPQHLRKELVPKKRISSVAGFILIGWAMILDFSDLTIISLGVLTSFGITPNVLPAVVVRAMVILTTLGSLPFPITDIVAAGTIDAYLIAKRISPVRMLMGNALELIPWVGVLPLFTIFTAYTVLHERNQAKKARKEMNQGVGKFRRTVRGFAESMEDDEDNGLDEDEATESRVEKAHDLRKRLPGKFRHAFDEQASRMLEDRLPGPLRSLPDGNRGFHAAWRGGSARAGIPLPPSSLARKASPLDDNPFPGTFEAIERKLIPQNVADIAGIDVGGARAAGTPPPAPRKRIETRAR